MTTFAVEPMRDEIEMPDFPKHELEAPGLSEMRMFYPMGFPVEVRTNSPEVLSIAHGIWSIFAKRFEAKPIRVDVHVLDGDLGACPPAPVTRIAKPLLINIADTGNYSVADLPRVTTQIVLTRSTLRYRNYLEYFFLGGAPLCHIATTYATPIHAGCVARNGKGILLCGESGAGKSTLSYACARAGWTYTTDDASFLVHGIADRTVVGNCHQVRFRPSAGELFPEIQGREITPRAAGKPSVELPTAPMHGMICAPTARVEFLVFLKRRASGPASIAAFSKAEARSFLRQVLFGMPQTLAVQYAALERLLEAEILQLQYSDLERAVECLEALTGATRIVETRMQESNVQQAGVQRSADRETCRQEDACEDGR